MPSLNSADSVSNVPEEAPYVLSFSISESLAAQTNASGDRAHTFVSLTADEASELSSDTQELAGSIFNKMA